MADQFMEVRVPVPTSRLAEFYLMVGQWLQSGDGNAAIVASGAQSLSERKHRPWSEGSEADRRRDALMVYTRMSTGARAITDVLLDRKGKPVSGEELSDMLGLPLSGLNGTLASAGLRSRAVGRELPFRRRATSQGGRYEMDPAAAELFDWARKAPPEELPMQLGSRGAAAQLRRLREEHGALEAALAALTSDSINDGDRHILMNRRSRLENDIRQFARIAEENERVRLDRAEQVAMEKEEPGKTGS